MENDFKTRYATAMLEIIPICEKHFHNTDELSIALANALSTCFIDNPNLKLCISLVQALAEYHNENAIKFLQMANPVGNA